MSSTAEQTLQIVQTLAAQLVELRKEIGELREELTELRANLNTEHREAQDALRSAVANTAALCTWVRETPIDNPPPDAGVMDAAVAEAKTSRAGGVLLAPAAPTKKLTKAAYFVECWTKEEFRADYAAAKAAHTVPARTKKDTPETFLVKEAKAVHKCLSPEEEARFKVVYASYTTKT